MKIIHVNDYEEMSKEAAKIMIEDLSLNPFLNVCYAVGNTNIGMFNEVIKEYNKGNVSFRDSKAFLLDEYCNNTYHLESGAKYFLKAYFLNHVNIKSFNIFAPNADQDDLDCACSDYNLLLEENPIDLAVLGIGANGHIGYNEPNTPFDSETHIQKLEFKTRLDRQKFFGNNLVETPTHAVTMGIKNILDCKKILLLISGESKRDAYEKLINGEICEAFPASALKNHKNVIVIIDNKASSE